MFHTHYLIVSLTCFAYGPPSGYTELSVVPVPSRAVREVVVVEAIVVKGFLLLVFLPLAKKIELPEGKRILKT